MLGPCARLGTSHKQISHQDLTRPMAEILVDTATEDFFTHIIFPRFFCHALYAFGNV